MPTPIFPRHFTVRDDERHRRSGYTGALLLRPVAKACSVAVDGLAIFFNNFRMFLRKKQIRGGTTKTADFVGNLYQHRTCSEMSCQTVLEYFLKLLSE